MFSWKDYFKLAEKIEDSIKSSIEEQMENYPIEGKKNYLKMQSIKFDGTQSDPKDYVTQIESKLKSDTWGPKLTADFELREIGTHKLIDKKKISLGRIPVPTSRATFIVDGNEYTIMTQHTTKAGIYHQLKDNGKISARINLSRQKRFYKKGLKIDFDQDKSKFIFNHGNDKIPIYPILKTLGAADDEMLKEWGHYLFSKNVETEVVSEKKLRKFAEGLAGEEDYIAKIKAAFTETSLDPEVVKYTLDSSDSSLTKNLLLKSSTKLMKISKGEVESDDSDAAPFRKFRDITNFLKDRILITARGKGSFFSSMKRRVDKDDLSLIVTPQKFSSPIYNIFKKDTDMVTAQPNQNNILSIIADATRISPLGQGGLTNEKQITNSMRDTNFSFLGAIDPVHTSSGPKVGINTHLSMSAFKSGDDMYVPSTDVKTGKEQRVPISSLYDKNVAFSDSTGKKGRIKVMRRGKVKYVPVSEVDHYIDFRDTMGTLTNFIPFITSDNGDRLNMSAKFLEQAVSLTEREAPLVSTEMKNGKTFQEALGKSMSRKSNTNGTVKSINEKKGTITIISDKGEKRVHQIYNNFFLSDKSYLHDEPIVKVGDRVKKGQIIAENNYIKDGKAAVGKNLKVAFLAYMGQTFEDGVVISESAAKKLRSNHMYKVVIPVDEDTILDTSIARSLNPSIFRKDELSFLDGDGTVKEGTTLKTGNPVAFYAKKSKVSDSMEIFKRRQKRFKGNLRVKHETWDKDVPGKVIYKIRKKDKIILHIKTEEPMKVGDKLSNMHGNKGIVTKILSDSEMPITAGGDMLDVMFNPHGVPSRMNLGQLYEGYLGKVSRKTGEKFVINNSKPRWKRLMKEVGQRTRISDKEEIIDPIYGKLDSPAFVGDMYILKLKHKIDDKMQVREPMTSKYSLEDEPGRGSKETSQVMNPAKLYAMLAHGAHENLYEMSANKSSKNEEFWDAIRNGTQIPEPKESFINRKFFALLRGAGIGNTRSGNLIKTHPFLDKHIDSITNGEITAAKFFASKTNLTAERGGLFDTDITGGEGGKKWSHISLAYPVPHPTFEKAIYAMMGVNKDSYHAIIDGKMGYDLESKTIIKNDFDKLQTGASVIGGFLNHFDMEKEISSMKLKDTTDMSLKELNDYNLKYRFIDNMLSAGLDAKDLMMTKVPVLPPHFRPLYSKDNYLNAGSNILYSDLLNTNNAFKSEKDWIDDPNEISKTLYHGVGAIMGSDDNYFEPLSAKAQLVKKKKTSSSILGVMSGYGRQPKESWIHTKILSKRQELSGFTTIIPDMKLSLDQIGLPEKMAWSLFRPFIFNDLKKSGMKTSTILDEIKNQSSTAKSSLMRVMDNHPVLINREPTLHKHGMLAFQPTLTTGEILRIPPLVTGGFGADFDGDCCLGSVKIELNKGLLPDLYYSYLDSEDRSMIKDAGILTTFKTSVDLKNFPRIESSQVLKKNCVEYNVPKGVSVPAYIDGKFETKEVTKYSVHFNCGEAIIKTKNGRELICSTDHSLLAIDDDTLEVIKQKPINCLNKCVPILKKIVNQNPPKEIQWSDEEYGDDHKKHPYCNTIPMDYRFGQFLGFMIGDRWISSDQYKGSPKIKELCMTESNRKNPIFNLWSDFLMKISDLKISIVENPHLFKGEKSLSVKMMNTNSKFAEWLKPLISSDGNRSDSKKLPSWAITCSVEFRRGLFNGLMDTNGTFHWHHKNNPNKNPQFSAAYTTLSSRLTNDIKSLCLSLGIPSSVSVSKQKNHCVYLISMSIPDIKKNLSWIRPVSIQKSKALRELSKREIGNSPIDIIPMTEQISSKIKELLSIHRLTSLKGGEGNKETFSIDSIIDEHKGYCARYTAMKVLTVLPPEAVEELPKPWVEWATDDSLGWDVITKVEITGNKKTMYDLTVPEAWTFTMEDGMGVQDSMSIFVPSSPSAIREARQLTPSKNLYSPAVNFKIMNNFSQEFVTGISQASKTEAGLKEINKLLPEWSQLQGPLENKKDISNLIRTLAEKDPKNIGNHLTTLKNYSAKKAYTSGFSVGFEDFLYDNDEKDEKIQGLTEQYFDEPDAAKRNKLINDFLDDDFSKVKKKGGSMVQMATSGAKGSDSQIKQIMSGVGFISGISGKSEQNPVLKSYSDGLDPIDYFTITKGSRMGEIASTITQREPGYYSKELGSLLSDMSITEHDCGAHGDKVSSEKANVIGRFLAEDIPNVARKGVIIDNEIYSKIKKNKIKEMRVRTPLSCKSPRGVCVLDAGADSQLKPMPIGTNIGPIVSTSLVEPIQQSTFSVRHEGGTSSGGEKEESKFENVVRLTSMSKSMDGAALSEFDGRIKKVTSVDGHNQSILIGTSEGDKIVEIPDNKKIKAKKGDAVERGSALTSGHINPHDLIKLKGPMAVRQQLSNELFDQYKDMGLKRSLTDILARRLTNLSVVKDPGGNPDYVAGDYVQSSILDSLNSEKEVNVKLRNSVGRKAARDIYGLKAGQEITASIADGLSKSKIEKLPVMSNPIQSDAVLVGSKSYTKFSKDFIKKLALRGIHDNIINSAIKGEGISLDQYNPVGRWAVGAKNNYPSPITRRMLDGVI